MTRTAFRTLVCVSLLASVAHAAIPLINSATVDYANNTLTVSGTSFGSNPKVTVGGMALTVQTSTAIQIVAVFPLSTSGLAPGSYSLTLAFSNQWPAFFEVALGARPSAAGRCYNDTDRFVDCSNGTVTDTETGLIWLKNANCFAISDYATTNNDAAGLHTGQCGLTDGSSTGDWRLPTVAEWQSIVQPSCSNPVLPDRLGNGCYATNVADQWATGVQTAYCYWSSTALAGDPNSAWSLSLSVNDIGSGWKTTFCFVWPVRGGGTGNEVQR